MTRAGGQGEREGDGVEQASGRGGPTRLGGGRTVGAPRPGGTQGAGRTAGTGGAFARQSKRPRGPDIGAAAKPHGRAIDGRRRGKGVWGEHEDTRSRGSRGRSRATKGAGTGGRARGHRPERRHGGQRTNGLRGRRGGGNVWSATRRLSRGKGGGESAWRGTNGDSRGEADESKEGGGTGGEAHDEGAAGGRDRVRQVSPGSGEDEEGAEDRPGAETARRRARGGKGDEGRGVGECTGHGGLAEMAQTERRGWGRAELGKGKWDGRVVRGTISQTTGGPGRETARRDRNTGEGRGGGGSQGVREGDGGGASEKAEGRRSGGGTRGGRTERRRDGSGEGGTGVRTGEASGEK